jgi:hypothetical protein
MDGPQRVVANTGHHIAINFVTNEDEQMLQDIQRFYNTGVDRAVVAFPP